MDQYDNTKKIRNIDHCNCKEFFPSTLIFLNIEQKHGIFFVEISKVNITFKVCHPKVQCAR